MGRLKQFLWDNNSKWVNSVPLTLNERREVFNYEEIDDEMMNEIYI
ncbi:MAG: hypothetical protein RLZZ115_2776, partial [Cyanobacteriota bacterium]